MSAIVEMRYVDKIDVVTEDGPWVTLGVDQSGRLRLGEEDLAPWRTEALPEGDLRAAFHVLGAEDGLDAVKLNGAVIWSWAAEQAAKGAAQGA